MSNEQDRQAQTEKNKGGRPPMQEPPELKNVKGIDIAETQYDFPFGDFDIGKYCGAYLKKQMGLLFDKPHGCYCYPTKNKWEIIDREVARTFAQKGPREILAEYFKEQREAAERREYKQWWNSQLLKIRGSWSSVSVMDGIRSKTEGELPEAEPNNLPAKDAVYVIMGGCYRAVPFNSERHFHKATTPINPSNNPEVFKELWASLVPDDESREYLRGLFGSAILGKTHRLSLFVDGRAGSGKTTLQELITTAMGDLAITGNDELFDPLNTNHNGLLCDLIENQPKFLLMPEAQKSTVQCGLFNRMTGHDTLTSRRPGALGKERAKGRVRAFPIFFGESVPEMKDMTEGTIERIIVMKLPTIAKDRRDKTLIKQAQEPLSPLCASFLLWLVEAACYATGGEFDIGNVPTALLDTKDQAIGDMDEFTGWMKSQLPGHMKEQEGKRMTSQHIAAVYKDATGTEISASKVTRNLKNFGGDFIHMRINNRSGFRLDSPPFPLPRMPE